MGYRDYKQNSSSTLWNTANPMVMLIILNALVFILLNFLKSIYTFSSLTEASFYQDIYHLFAMPADPSTFLKRPWTLLTMQFSEVKLFVAISNLFWLWTFAYLVQDLVGSDKLIPLYLYSGTVSAIVFFATANLIYGNQPLHEPSLTPRAKSSVCSFRRDRLPRRLLSREIIRYRLPNRTHIAALGRCR